MPASARVLLVGAHEPLGGLRTALTEAAFDVHVEVDPLRACTLLRNRAFDAVVARLAEPGTDALALLRAARRHSPPAVTLFRFADTVRDSVVLETVNRAPETAVVTSDDPAVTVEAVRSLLRGDLHHIPPPEGVDDDPRVRGLLASIEVAEAARVPADLDGLRWQIAGAARGAAGSTSAWLVAWDEAGERVQKVGETAAPPGLAAEVRLARRPIVRHGRGAATSFIGVPIAADQAVTAALLVEFDSGVDASGGLPFAEALTRLARLSEVNVRLQERAQRSTDALTSTLWTALALRGLDVEGHARRVAELAAALARSTDLATSIDDLLEIRRAALLHDVGKLGLPDALLRGDSLTDDECDIARRHPLLAEHMLNQWGELEGAARLVRSSRERWDGTGYPDGLVADAIPLGSRLLAVADAWDGLMFGVGNRPGRSVTSAVEALRRQAGSHLDPEVVRAFEAMRWEGTPSGAVDTSSGRRAVA